MVDIYTGDDQALQRSEFVLPTNRPFAGKAGAHSRIVEADLDKPCTYLCGNSLGAQPKKAELLVVEEIYTWGSIAVEGHFNHPEGRAWKDMTDHVNPMLSELVGATSEEVACMGTLTTNLHLMMNTFYKPTTERYKILCEAKAFPSDQYAFASQATLHGFNPHDAVLALSPRPGEFTLRDEDILAAIEREGPSVALVLFPAVQYYTGQWFAMERITRAAKAQGCMCGWDLAHGIGNVPMKLHDWNVDFAVWCSYKYLNAGPGGIAGLFVHEKWAELEKPKFAGWWGHDPSSRFAMPPTFSPIRGAQGYQQSNPSVLCIAALLGSLQVFRAAGMMPSLRKRSLHLTGRLYDRLLKSERYVPLELAEKYGQEDKNAAKKSGARPAFSIITPADPMARGAQLSLLILPTGAGVMEQLFTGLKNYGVIGDERSPDVIRLAPAPLYNTEEECDRAVEVLQLVFAELD